MYVTFDAYKITGLRYRTYKLICGVRTLSEHSFVTNHLCARCDGTHYKLPMSLASRTDHTMRVYYLVGMNVYKKPIPCNLGKDIYVLKRLG